MLIVLILDVLKYKYQGKKPAWQANNPLTSDHPTYNNNTNNNNNNKNNNNTNGFIHNHPENEKRIQLKLKCDSQLISLMNL